jgi:hypothetical protein
MPRHRHHPRLGVLRIALVFDASVGPRATQPPCQFNSGFSDWLETAKAITQSSARMSNDETGETEESWQERFRDALAQGNAKAVAKTLREVTSLDRSAIEALANLLKPERGTTAPGRPCIHIN